MTGTPSPKIDKKCMHVSTGKSVLKCSYQKVKIILISNKCQIDKYNETCPMV